MPDNISNLIDPSVHSDLQKLIDELTDADLQMLKLVKDGASLVVVPPGQLATLEQFNAYMAKSGEGMAALTQGAQQYTAQVERLVPTITATTGEIKSLQRELKTLQEYQNKANPKTEAYKIWGREIEGVKTKIAQLSGAMQSTNVQINNTANSIKFMGVSAASTESMLARMTIRMIAMQLVFAPIIAGVTALIENFKKLSDTEQLAADRLQAYTDAAKSFQSSRLNLIPETLAQILQKESEAKSQLSIMQTSGDLEIRFNAYKKLQSIYPKVFDDMDKETFKANEGNERMKERIKTMDQYGQKTILLAKEREKQAENFAVQQKNEQELSDLVKKRNELVGRNVSLADEKTITTKTQTPKTYVPSELEATQIAINKARQDKAQFDNDVKTFEANTAKLDAEIAKMEGKTKDRKTRPEKDAKKEMEAELKLEEQKYKIKVDTNKAIYDNSRKTFAEEKILLDENKAAADEHYKKMSDIVTKYHGKVGETETMYAERKAQQAADQLKVDNAINEEEAKIAREIQKRHEAENKAIDEQLEKLRKLRYELRQQAAELDAIRAKSQIDHKYAQGGGAYLEAFGFDSSFRSEQKKRDVSIEKSRDTITDLSNQQGEEANNVNHPPDLEKILDFEKQINAEKINLAEQEADKQAAIDAKILEGKKQMGERTIELAKTIFESVKTIQDNAFAAEQKQIQIEMQSTELQSKQKIAAIDATAGYQIAKDNEKAKVVAQTTAKENELQQKSNQLQLKKAIADKKNAELAIIAATAMAEVKTLAAYAGIPGGLAIAIPLMAIEAGIGAAQYAAVASQPLPQFKHGTDATTTPLFIAGDGGEREYIKAPGKKGYWTTETAAVYNEPIGTSITPEHKMMEYAAANINNIVAPAAGAGKNEMKEAINELKDKFEEVGEEIAYAVIRSRNQPINIYNRGRTDRIMWDNKN